MVQVEEGTRVDGDGRAAERTGTAHAITQFDAAKFNPEERAVLQVGARTGERGYARADVEDLTVAGEVIGQGDVIRAVDLEDAQGGDHIVVDRDRARARMSAGAELKDAIVHIDAAGEQVGARKGHLTRAFLGQLQLTTRDPGTVAIVDQDTSEREITRVADRESGNQVLRVRDEARARELRDD